MKVSPFYTGSICQLFIIRANRPLIVKSLKPEYCDVPILVERFVNEANVLRSINNRQTPAFIKSRLDSNRPYFAYEYIEGKSLASRLLEQRISNKDCIDIIRQLLMTLSSLHQGKQTIIHSDICPDNIVITERGRLYLIDFGCSCRKTLNSNSAHTWIGKHAYLSPEQAQGQHWSLESDLYQVGLIFYEMMTGLRRNTGKTIRDMIPIAANPPALYLDKINTQYHDFINKILAVDSTQRHHSARQALLELNNI